MSETSQNTKTNNPIIETMIGIISGKITSQLMQEGILPTAQHHLGVKQSITNMYQKIAKNNGDLDKEAIALSFLSDLQKIPDLHNNHPDKALDYAKTIVEELKPVVEKMSSLENQAQKEIAKMTERASKAEQGGINLN